ncbi:MAG: hypothetical protein KAT37_00095 [Candidatus Aenigmarchaeota archaeon]|nr:hypothetical protein [Candidatus Aenigmarchaeota archaeon]
MLNRGNLMPTKKSPREAWIYQELESLPADLFRNIEAISVENIQSEGETWSENVFGYDINTRKNYLSKIKKRAEELNADIVKEMSYDVKLGKVIDRKRKILFKHSIYETLGLGLVGFFKVKNGYKK